LSAVAENSNNSDPAMMMLLSNNASGGTGTGGNDGNRRKAKKARHERHVSDFERLPAPGPAVHRLPPARDREIEEENDGEGSSRESENNNGGDDSNNNNKGDAENDSEMDDGGEQVQLSHPQHLAAGGGAGGGGHELFSSVLARPHGPLISGSEPLAAGDARQLVNGEHDRNGEQPVMGGQGKGPHHHSNDPYRNGASRSDEDGQEEPTPLPERSGDQQLPEVDDSATAASPDEILQLHMHESEVFMCAWNPVFTQLIATGSGDASARIWEMNGGTTKAGISTVKTLPHGSDPKDKKNKDVTTLEWSFDGQYLATGSYDGVARVWARSGALLHTLRRHTGPIFSLKWNRNGNYILSGSYDTTAIVWDVSEPKADQVVQQFTDHEAPTLDVDWRDNQTFATCSTDKKVHIYMVGLQKPLKVYVGHNDEVNAVKWDPSGRFLASCSDDCTAKVWEVDSDRPGPLYDLTSHTQEIYTVKWSPTGAGSANPDMLSLLATASFDGTVRLWNVLDGSCFRTFDRHRDSVYSVAFSPSGRYLASGSLAGQLYIWHIERGEQVKSFKGTGDIFEVAWNKEETMVAACFSSNVVAIMDFDRWQAQQ
jgi:transducin (beta)-like 1